MTSVAHASCRSGAPECADAISFHPVSPTDCHWAEIDLEAVSTLRHTPPDAVHQAPLRPCMAPSSPATAAAVAIDFRPAHWKRAALSTLPMCACASHGHESGRCPYLPLSRAAARAPTPLVRGRGHSGYVCERLGYTTEALRTLTYHDARRSVLRQEGCTYCALPSCVLSHPGPSLDRSRPHVASADASRSIEIG